ncbi:hypothetical protein I312_103850 [Cryptococcus bacillisporus CA1280]|uniref:D-aspartate oxidase n=1 Tax=Cryptococcus bacillisporus CA1280 TaxID=1296109 RepID=A0A0D0UB74_CRYGA|nr:D-aspartate oxidase [Cryptococcus bacillisporus CA1280]
MSPSLDSSRPIVIIGAGIIGLTTAVCLLESHYYKQHRPPIHIIADHLPNDPLDAKYASTIAGAHHMSFADDGDERQRKWDMRTFQIMYEQWRQLGEESGLMALKQTELFVGQKDHLKIYEEHPNFMTLPVSELPPDVDHAVSFTSLTITPSVYLNRLIKQISSLSNGKVRIHRFHLPCLSFLSHPSITALIGQEPPAAVMICVGLGALLLGGVNDSSVYPTRGQVVKIRAPWVRSGYTRQVGNLNGGEGGERTYVIPRANGEIILGGTREEGDWYPYPREETTKDILKRALEICPNLCPANLVTQPLSGTYGHSSILAANEQSPSHENPLDSLIIDSLVGFRPSRKGGIRLERGPDLGENTAAIYNYGHGGAGWQSSWGTAEEAVALLCKAIGN